MITAGTTGSHALGAGASEGFTVVCHPAAVGAITGTFTISSNDPNAPTISIPLTCTGTDSSLAIVAEPGRVADDARRRDRAEDDHDHEHGRRRDDDPRRHGHRHDDDQRAGAGHAARRERRRDLRRRSSSTRPRKGDVSGTMHIDYDNGKSVDTQITAKAVKTSLSLTPDGDVEFGPGLHRSEQARRCSA